MIKDSTARRNPAPHLKSHYLKTWMAHHAYPHMNKTFTRAEQVLFLARSAMYHFGIQGDPCYPFTFAANLLIEELGSDAGIDWHGHRDRGFGQIKAGVTSTMFDVNPARLPSAAADVE